MWWFWYIRGCARYQPHTLFFQQRVSVHYRATSRQESCLPCPGFCHGLHSLSKIITTGHHSFAILLWILLWWQSVPSRFAVFSVHIDIGRCFLKSFDTYKPFSIATWPKVITSSGSMRNVHNVFSWRQRWVEGSLSGLSKALSGPS